MDIAKDAAPRGDGRLVKVAGRVKFRLAPALHMEFERDHKQFLEGNLLLLRSATEARRYWIALREPAAPVPGQRVKLWLREDRSCRAERRAAPKKRRATA